MMIDRVVEFPNRYDLVDNNGNTFGTYTLTRNEGEIVREGTPLNAANLNPAVIIYSNTIRVDPDIPGVINAQLSPPTGKTAIGVIGISTAGFGKDGVHITDFYIQDNHLKLEYYDTGDEDFDWTITVYILCV